MQNNKLKTSASTWNNKVKLPDVSYSVYDIQDYFEYIIKKPETQTGNIPVGIYVNRIENRVTFQNKTGYSFEFLTPETMKLLGSTKTKITKVKINEHLPYFKIFEVLLPK